MADSPSDLLRRLRADEPSAVRNAWRIEREHAARLQAAAGKAIAYDAGEPPRDFSIREIFIFGLGCGAAIGAWIAASLIFIATVIHA